MAGKYQEVDAAANALRSAEAIVRSATEQTRLASSGQGEALQERIEQLERERIAQLELLVASASHSPLSQEFARLLDSSKELHAVASERDALKLDRDRLEADLRRARDDEAASSAHASYLASCRASVQQAHVGQQSKEAQTSSMEFQARVAELESMHKRQRTMRDELNHELQAASAAEGRLRSELEVARMQRTDTEVRLATVSPVPAGGPATFDLPIQVDGAVRVVTLSLRPEAVTDEPIVVSRHRSQRTLSSARLPVAEERRQRTTTPTEASRGWRMSFSPDWRTEDRMSRDEWLSSKSRFIGRTAAHHAPWTASDGRNGSARQSRRHISMGGYAAAATPVAHPSSTSHHDGADSSLTTSTAARTTPAAGCAAAASSAPAFGGGSARGDELERPTYRSNFAWSQHRFPGEHYKEERHVSGTAHRLD
jgi:hypothetical protein